jgi:hypothetical protein
MLSKYPFICITLSFPHQTRCLHCISIPQAGMRMIYTICWLIWISVIHRKSCYNNWISSVLILLQFFSLFISLFEVQKERNNTQLSLQNVTETQAFDMREISSNLNIRTQISKWRHLSKNDTLFRWVLM